MPLKKSELYSSLWASCDELRGGMDASQYKDYVLVLLFVKYVSDKAASQKNYLLDVPKGGSFADMLALKGKKDIGEQMDIILSKLAEANDLRGTIDVASFNDDDKLGKGKEMVDRLSLHTLAESGQLAQSAFLDLSGDDPSESFARALITACGETGPVFVYNAAFETTRIRELADRYPALAGPLLGINARVVDLYPIARNRYYHPSQQGTWSIKAVLPAIVPELSYDKLDGVADGGMAMDAFSEAIQPGKTGAEDDHVRAWSGGVGHGGRLSWVSFSQ